MCGLSGAHYLQENCQSPIVIEVLNVLTQKPIIAGDSVVFRVKLFSPEGSLAGSYLMEGYGALGRSFALF